MYKEKLTFALVVGTRGFFNPDLARVGRAQLIEQITQLGHKAIIMPTDATPTGVVETEPDAQKCADYFNAFRKEIDGVIVALPNFGDEIGIACALHYAKLDVPVLIQASDDDLDKVDTLRRRDSFCGKLSVCNNLYQYGIPFTDTTTHTVALGSPAFAQDIEYFAGVCRVTKGLKHARIGAIGARPAAFQTMRSSEKLLQAYGITTISVDLSDIFGAAQRVDVKSERARRKLEELRAYGKVPARIGNLDAKFEKHLRFFVAVDDWIQANRIDCAGIQCWTSMQQNFGCASCLTMSMLGNALIPCSCEVDITGALSMYALTLAQGNAAAIVDWNNNYADQRNKCVAQHCGNYPKSFTGTEVEVSTLDVMSNNVGEEICFGAIKGRVAPGPFTYLRFMTDDRKGRIRGYVGEGTFTDDPFNMTGGIAVCEVPELQQLMKYLCKNGFEHHCAMVRRNCASIIAEAATTYLGWDMYVHE